MKIYIPIILIIGLFFLTPDTYAQKAKPVFLNEIRSMAMGGAGIASARGTFSYLYNPALLTRESFHITVPGLQLEMGDNFMDIVNYITDNSDDFKKLDKEQSNISADEEAEILNDLRSDAAKLDNIWYKAMITPDVGVVIGNIGISMYNVAQFASKIDVGVIVPKVKVYAVDDLVLSFGYGHQLNERVALGIGAKIIRRFESPVIKLQVEESSTMDETLDEAFDEMQEGKSGFGLDFGCLYQLNERITLAAVAQDFVGRIDTLSTQMNFKIGMAYQLNNQLTIAADLEDFFNQDGDKLVNKIYAGLEYSLPIIKARIGFAQGYPTFGIGLNLWILDLGYTYYTKEITDSPGLKGESYHIVGLRFGWQ